MVRILRTGRQLRRCLDALAPDRRAATAVEYGLILALIVLTIFGAMAAVGNQTSSMWNNVHAAVTGAH